MARTFDGVNDDFHVGSDAALDDVTTVSFLCWVNRTTNDEIFVSKGTEWFFGNQASGLMRYSHNWSGVSPGHRMRWTKDVALTTGLHQVGFTLDFSSASNQIIMYEDNVAYTVAGGGLTQNNTPTGTFNTDAADDLMFGSIGGNVPFTGEMSHVVFHNGILTAAQVNEHYNYGGRHDMTVWHPLLDDNVTAPNKGTATAAMVNNGTTAGSLARVERCYGGMMGCGR